MKNLISNQDCYSKSTDEYCYYNIEKSCSIFSYSSTRVPNCQNRLADYLHLRYRCVPASISSSISIKEYKICDSQAVDITDLNGFISSPNFPTYTMQPTECLRKIQVPNNMIINMYIFNDFKFPGFNDEYFNLQASSNFTKIKFLLGVLMIIFA
jgi:hypothetical protein